MSEAVPRILFVEDDHGKRYVISRQLRQHGFVVDEAETGGQGLALVSPQHDVAVLDMRLPDMYGGNLCQQLKADPRTASIMVLALSAIFASPEDRARGLDHGADAYLIHPVELIELVATLRALIRLRRAERERERHRELFLGTVGHDLRNPLSTISTAAQVLGGSASLGEHEHTMVRTIESTVDRMSRLLDQLLTFTQGVAGGVPLERAMCDLGDVLDGVVRMHAEHGEIALDNRVRRRVRIDRTRIEQLVDNLVTNAIRYGEGPIDIRAWDDGGTIVIAVHNMGTPIPAEALPTLFEPYRRASSSHSGLGLGLYIVKVIARAHGGTVGVTSTQDAGTTFTVRLPAA